MKLCICLACYVSFACSISDVGVQNQKKERDFRVLGYLFVHEELKEEVENVDWDSYTEY